MKNSELLVAVVCIPVALWVGVIIARVFPERLPVEWGSVGDLAVATGTAATALVAWKAYRAWGAQLVATSQHKAALEIAEAAHELQDNFHYARRTEVDGWEVRLGIQPHKMVDIVAAALKARMEVVIGLGKNLNALRYRARAVLKRPSIADDMTALVHTARDLADDFSNRIEQVRRNELTDNITSTDTARKVDELLKRLEDSLEEFIPGR